MGVIMVKFEELCNVGSLDSCWNWLGSKRGAGYAQCSDKVHHSRIASRAVYEQCCGPIKDAWVLHTCDNTLCVNPTHLFLGTPKDNTQDMMSKGRFGTHIPNRNYNTAAARARLAELQADPEYRKAQGRKIQATQSARRHQLRNQQNILRFAFNFTTQKV